MKEFEQVKLRTYHSFTKGLLHEICPRVQSAYPGVDMTAWTLRNLTEQVPQDAPVSVCRYEFATPPYMQEWSRKYNQGPNWIAVFRVEVIGHSRGGSHNQTIFLPAA